MTNAKDGHSATEERIYTYLYKKANGGGRSPTSADSWTVQAGYGELAKEGHCSRNTAIRSVAALIEKLSLVRLKDGTDRKACIYRIFSFGAILDRRASAGLTHFVRGDGGRVSIVNPAMGIPKSGELGIPMSISPHELGISDSGTPHIPDSGTHLKYNKDNKQKQPSTTADSPPEFAAGMRQLIPLMDTPAIERIWQESRDAEPACSSTDLIDLATDYLSRLGGRSLNPTGALIRHIPQAVRGAPLDALRAERERKGILEAKDRERIQKWREREQAELESILQDQANLEAFEKIPKAEQDDWLGKAKTATLREHPDWPQKDLEKKYSSLVRRRAARAWREATGE